MGSPSKSASSALALENEFLSGVRRNLEAAQHSILDADAFEFRTDDEGDQLRATMAERRMYDRDLLGRLPQNRRVEMRGIRRRFWFWRRPSGSIVATVLCDFNDLLGEDDQPSPVGAADLRRHVERVIEKSPRPCTVAVCVPFGFTSDARQNKFEVAGVKVLLVEPDEAGGWRISAGDSVSPEIAAIFDPESAKEKIERVKEAIADRSSDLLTGGVSAEQIARQLRLPKDVVYRAVEDIARQDPELMTADEGDDRLLYRGVASHRKEKAGMGFVDRIREMFAGEGDEASKINTLSQRRAALVQRRDRLYEDIGKLEEREADLLKQGRENKSAVVRRRLAAQVAQLRKDIARVNTTANMLNQQINIISTDIHNLTLIQQGEMASLPSTEELTENAVRAEEMLETLKSDADMVASLETNVDALTSSEEQDILAEFEAPEADAAPASSAGARAESTPAAEESRSAAAPRQSSPEPAPPTPAAEDEQRQARDPEAS